MNEYLLSSYQVMISQRDFEKGDTLVADLRDSARICEEGKIYDMAAWFCKAADFIEDILTQVRVQKVIESNHK